MYPYVDIAEFRRDADHWWSESFAVGRLRGDSSVEFRSIVKTDGVAASYLFQLKESHARYNSAEVCMYNFIKYKNLKI